MAGGSECLVVEGKVLEMQIIKRDYEEQKEDKIIPQRLNDKF